MTLRTLALLLIVIFLTPICAADMGGANVVIPIAGRTAGAYGSQWRTDLVITNLQPQATPIHLTFYASATDRTFTNATLPANGTLLLEDVLSATFLRDAGMGMLRVNSAMSGARFVARAYIYNASASGEFGQGVNAVPLDALTGEHVLSGVTSFGGRRTNIGVANPWPVPATVTLTLQGRDGEELGKIHRTVSPSEVLQLNDAFAAFDATPVPEASVRVRSNVGVYAYASIVRADTGDAIFVPGSGVNVGAGAIITPQCSDPASLNVAPRGAASQGWIVLMQDGTAPDYIANVLPERHGFKPDVIFDVVTGFAAELTQQQIAALRCDGTVLMIEENVTAPAAP